MSLVTIRELITMVHQSIVALHQRPRAHDRDFARPAVHARRGGRLPRIDVRRARQRDLGDPHPSDSSTGSSRRWMPLGHSPPSVVREQGGALLSRAEVMHSLSPQVAPESIPGSVHSGGRHQMTRIRNRHDRGSSTRAGVGQGGGTSSDRRTRYIAAIAVRAPEEVIVRQVRSLTCHYLRPPSSPPDRALRPEVVPTAGWRTGRFGRRLPGRKEVSDGRRRVLEAELAVDRDVVAATARRRPAQRRLGPLPEYVRRACRHLKGRRGGLATLSGKEKKNIARALRGAVAAAVLSLSDPPAQIDAGLRRAADRPVWPPSLRPPDRRPAARDDRPPIHFLT